MHVCWLVLCCLSRDETVSSIPLFLVHSFSFILATFTAHSQLYQHIHIHMHINFHFHRHVTTTLALCDRIIFVVGANYYLATASVTAIYAVDWEKTEHTSHWWVTFERSVVQRIAVNQDQHFPFAHASSNWKRKKIHYS